MTTVPSPAGRLRTLLRPWSGRPRVAVIRLAGMIGMGRARALTDEGLAPLIEAAFRGRPAAVALEINSPGGSAVQSSLIAARIRRLADEKGVPVLAFVEDVAASGGYWLATAADEIWCDEGSMLGSIGVISAGFGFQDLIAKLGVERRLHMAGRSKALLDPFRPEKPEDVARLEGWLAQLHAVFIAQVQARRGPRLADDPDLFTGEIWIGRQAVEKGLADGIGHLVPTLKARFGDKVRLRRLVPRRPVLARLGLSVAEESLGLLEERAAFARFGL
ncbi:Periplasmic serine protease (ClpP class) [Rubellimicrobium thermophilum DSM 16684]|uniref:Periplasmic serine protease (ClpP class) n=1 Tax=Rubellimicrobium thermophilum DSM 16684 TaxID=1123069 RepID=S9QY01_9RHOB|nr:S49 family peptidase [Rubellimicrobium thermophilum]EPX84518.1 Periplasmic serine protease (ClpP class) [Rubellimicrobium thermophilum DSM 16684]